MKTSAFMLSVLGLSAAIRAQTLYWDNAGGTANDWGALANWSTVVGGGTNPPALPGASDTVVFSATSVAAAQTVNLNAARSVLGLSFTSGQAHTLQGGGTNRTLTLGTGGMTKSGTGAITIGSATAGQQVSLSLSADQTWANNNNTGAITINNGVSASTAVARILTLGGSSTAANTISGIIANNGVGVLTLNKTGAGLWVLNAANTYSGVTTISDGQLRLTNADALGSNASVVVQNNENPGSANTNSLQLSGGLTFGTGKTLILRNNSTSSISNARTELNNNSGNNTWAGNIQLDQGTNQTVASASGTLTISGNITQSGTPSTSMFIRGTATGILTGGMNIGSAQLYKTDTGTWTVSSAGNTHGTIIIGNGTLIANNNNAFDPTANLTLGEGNANATAFTINATFTQELANIANAATTSGAQTINGAGTLSTGSSPRTYTVTDVAAADDLTISTAITGAGGFTKQDAGTLFLNGSAVSTPASLAAGVLRGSFTATAGLTVNGGTLTPGATTTAGTVTANTLAFGPGATSIVFNTGNSATDVIQVTDAGGLTTAGTTTFTINPIGGFTAGNNYPLISYTGASPGTAGFALAPLPGRVVGNLTDTGTAIALNVTANDKVKWTGAVNATWDINTTANWQTVAGAAATNYLEGDDLVFADGAANTSITLGVTVNPANIEFTNSAATSYTLSGAGSLAGGMTMFKTGNGTVTLSGSAAHTYTGTTSVSAGTFAVNAATSNLTGTSGVDVSAGATLRLFSDNANFTFNRSLTGAGTVVIDPNAGGTAGVRDVTLSGTNTGFSGTLLLQPSGTVAANGSFRTVSTTAQANLGTAAIVVKPGGQLWWTGIINNNITISGTGYSESAGGTPAAGTGLAYGGIGALRLGTELAGTLTLEDTAKIMNHNGTSTVSGAIGVTNPSNLLVVGGGSSGSTTILTGANNAAGSSSLNQIWVNSGSGTSSGTDALQIGNNGTTGTLGVGDVFLHADNAKTALLRFSRSDGYTLAQNILASPNTASADLVRTVVQVNTTGTGLTLNGKTIDLSDGTAGGTLAVANAVNNSTLNIDAGSVVDIRYMPVGEAANLSGFVNQAGGAVSVIDQLRVGHYPTETSVYTMSGGTLTFSATPASTPSAGGEVNGGIYLGVDGTGIFNHSGGTVSTRFIVLDNRGNTGAGTNMPTGVDQYNLSGTGVLELNNAWGVIARNATTEFNWNGGTLRNTGSNIAVGLNTPITVGASGGTLDTVAAGNSFVLMNDITGAGTLTSTGGGTLTLNPDSNATRTGTSTGSGTQTISAALAGTSPVNKIGTGTTTLAGVNTYNGATTVTAGRLNVTGSAASSAFTVASGATLGGEGTVGDLSLAAGSTLFINPNTAGALTAAALGSAASNSVALEAIPSATGVITVLNYSGARTGAVSDFVLSNASSFRSPTFNDTGSAITLDTGAKALVWNGTSGGQWDLNNSARWNAAEADKFFWGDQVVFDDTGVDTAAVALTGDLRPGSITVNTSAKSYTLTASAGNVIAGTTSLLKAGTSVLTMAGNTANTFTGGTTIREGEIRVQNGGSLGTGTITLGDAGTGAGNTALYIDTNRSTVSVPVVISSNGAGTATLGSRSNIGATGGFGFSNITLQRDVILDSNAADRTDYTNIGGTGNITITGGARTLFNSPNTFAGDITVSPSGAGGYFQTGVATAGNQNYIPDTSNLTVNDFAGATQAEYRLSSGGETIAGLSGNGTIDVNSIAGTLSVGFGDATSTFSGQMINGGASVFSLTKIGAGTLTLTGNNTATGATTVNGGTLQIGTGGTTGSIGGGLSIAAGANAIVDRSDESALAGGLSGAGTFTKAGAGTFNLNATGSLSGTFNLTGGTVVFNATNPIGANATAAAVNLAAGTVLTTTTVSTHAHFGVLNMEGGATITTGPGTGSYFGENFQLNGDVTIAGGTTAAVITRDAGRNDGNSGLALRGTRTFTVADVTGSSAPDLIVSTQLEPSDNDTGANQGALIKAGPGTLLLTGANIYTGTTSVQAGTLLIDNAHTGGGLITVSAGASLGGSTGTGQIGPVDMSAGGSLLPGDSARTDNWMTVADMSLGSATQLFFELGLPDDGGGPLPANDLVTVTGSLLSLGGVLNVADLGGVASAPLGSRWQIFDMPNGAPATHALTLGTVPTRTDGLIYEIEALNSSVAAYLVVAVPEAGTAGLVAIGLLVLRRLRRR